jgi:hypothetical protein
MRELGPPWDVKLGYERDVPNKWEFGEHLGIFGEPK